MQATSSREHLISVFSWHFGPRSQAAGESWGDGAARTVGVVKARMARRVVRVVRMVAVVEIVEFCVG